MSSLLAQRSLVQHVPSWLPGCERGIVEGRRAVAMIVGRDSERLDAAGISRAAMESLAENLSNGVVAPLFWGVVGGLPGMLAYKAINTLDSMVGHRNERYRAFGWASAHCDNIVNLPAGASDRRPALPHWPAPAGTGRRGDAAGCAQHRSPNAGWPEAAIAAALGVRIAGPRVYGGVPGAGRLMGTGMPSLARPISAARSLSLGGHGGSRRPARGGDTSPPWLELVDPAHAARGEQVEDLGPRCLPRLDRGLVCAPACATAARRRPTSSRRSRGTTTTPSASPQTRSPDEPGCRPR